MRPSSQIRRRHVIALCLAFGILRGVFRDLLEDQMHEQEERLGLRDQHDRLVFRIVVQMLVDAGVLDDEGIARFSVEALAVMDVVAFALQHIENGAIHMTVALAVAAGREAVDMGLDRLGNLG